MPDSPAWLPRSSCSNWLLALPQLQQLALGVAALGHPVADVGPVEAVHEAGRIGQREPLENLSPGAGFGGGGERNARHRRKGRGQLGQAQVFRAKVMPPLGDAVRLVNGDQRQRAALQQRQGARLHESFRGDVDQTQLAIEQGGLGRCLFFGRQGRVEVGGGDAELAQRRHLIGHQRDQRRDHHPGAGTQQGRDLVAQRLAAAGRHEHEGIAPAGDGVDDRLLLATKGGVAIDLLKQRFSGGGRR